MAWTSPVDRAPLTDLLFRHRHEVAELRDELNRNEAVEVGNALVADDVWLLRYVLSFHVTKGAVAVAGEAAKKALQWRQENAALIDAARKRSPPPEFSDAELVAIELFFAAAFFCTSAFGDPLFISRLGSYNLKALMDQVSEEKMELWISYTNECVWQYCEAATRRRGFFVKQINIQDAAATAMSQERRFLRALGRSSKTNEWLRPQLIGKTYIMNPPTWLKLAHKIAGNFMSRKSLEKVWIHPGKIGVCAGSPSLCPFAQRLLGGVEALPSFLGGTGSSDDVFPAAPRPSAAVSSGARPAGARREPANLASLPQAEAEAPPPSASSRSGSRSSQTSRSAEDGVQVPRCVDQMSMGEVVVATSNSTSLEEDVGVEGTSLQKRWCCWRVCGRRRRRLARAAPLLPA